VNAIFAEGDVPQDETDFIELNRELSAQWPQLRKRKAALPDAEAWTGVPGKRRYLER
jgi:ferredoxin